MGRGNILTYSIILLLLVGFLIFLYFAHGKITGFSVYEQSSQSNFDEGTYSNTLWNGSAVILNSGQSSGNYISKVFDAGSTATWNNLSWVSNAIGELPGKGATETAFGNGNANMAGNVLLMHMNEASGTITDSSGLENNGTQSGGVTYGTTGKLNTAIGFDGTNDRIDIFNSQSLNITGAITIEAWVNMTAAGDVPRIVSKGFASAYELQAHLSVPRFVLTKSGGETFAKGTTNIVDSKFHHIVGTWDGTNMRLYVDANLEKTTALASPIDTTTKNVSIGARGGGATLNFFPGSIDEVAIWNRSLSTEEIQKLYGRGAIRLNLTVRSCDDSACSGEIFSDLNDSSPQKLSITNNRYFQYNFTLETNNFSYTPQIYKVTSDYTRLDSEPPNLTINSPSATTYTTSTILFNATAIDSTILVNSCWYTINSGAINQTLSRDGLTNFYNFTQTSIVDSSYTARFYCNDSANNINNTENVLFTIDTIVSEASSGSSGGSGGGGSSSSKKLNSTEVLENNKTSNRKNFSNNFVNEQTEISLIDVNRRKGFVDVEYLVKNLANEDQNVDLYFSILNSSENLKSEIEETYFIPANSERTFGTSISLDENLKEELILIIDFKKYSSSVSGSAPVRVPISGFLIDNNEKNKNNLITIIVLFLLFFVFALFILSKWIRNRKR